MLALVAPSQAAEQDAESVAFFEKHVRPILVTRCQECHGPAKQEAGLRLDLKAHAMRGSDAEPVIAPGDPEQSPLIAAVRYETYEMPPAAKLSDQEIAALTKWVELGAPWPDDGSKISATDNPASPESIAQARAEHWAFQPVVASALPAVANPGWIQTPVDAFVLARLEAAGFSPSPAADKQTLLRRVTYDLTGLPPTIEDVRAFEADAAPDAYERVVDRLLASPAYGERWARHWLDVARYADTQGFRAGNLETRYPYAYTYRDYVIRALNEDLPYDQFLQEQIAADLLPSQRDPRALAALGFLTVGPRFTGAIEDIVDDRIDVVTRGLLGMTVTCARCHDHKFDPIPQSDYYALAGIFFSCEEPQELPVIEAPRDTPEYQSFAAELEKRRKAYHDYLEAERAKLLARVRSLSSEYLLESLRKLYPEAASAVGDALPKERKLDERIVRRWNGYLRRSRSRHDPIFAPWHAAARLPQEEFAFYAPNAFASLWERAERRKDRPINPLVRQAIETAPPASLADLAALYGRLLDEVDQRWQQRVAATPTGEAVLLDPPAEQLRALLYGTEAPANLDPDVVEPSFDRAVKNELRKLENEIKKWQTESPHAPARAMVVRDLENPHDVPVLIRGTPGRPGKIAQRQFLTVLAGEQPEHFNQGSGRLQLAQAIASPDNPLTARVLVNRVWMHHFGAGLVRTPSDFGAQGEPPTHPELLDWLAARFMAEGWSIKKLHRWIVLSATYRQQSQLRPDCAVADPENRLLWRMQRRRLEYEALRDTLLVAAGRLDRTVTGRPVDLASEPFSRRRTVYGLIDREFLFAPLPIFNVASPDATTPKRAETTVPQQALYLMNAPFVIEQAKQLAARVEREAGAAPAERIRRLYQIVLQREATPAELERAESFIRSREASGAGEPLGPWPMLAQVLLMTNEMMYVD